MKGSRGVLVPSVSSPGTLSVLWLQDMGGRMQTSVTYGTVPDIDTRLGFLLLVDYCEQGLGVLGTCPRTPRTLDLETCGRPRRSVPRTGGIPARTVTG